MCKIQKDLLRINLRIFLHCEFKIALNGELFVIFPEFEIACYQLTVIIYSNIHLRHIDLGFSTSRNVTMFYKKRYIQNYCDFFCIVNSKLFWTNGEVFSCCISYILNCLLSIDSIVIFNSSQIGIFILYFLTLMINISSPTYVGFVKMSIPKKPWLRPFPCSL